jgi:hypothetical protein
MAATSERTDIAAGVAAPAMPSAHDPADEAMCLRARERYAADRKRGGRRGAAAATPRCPT